MIDQKHIEFFDVIYRRDISFSKGSIIQPFDLYPNSKLSKEIKGGCEMPLETVWFEIADSLSEAFKLAFTKRKKSKFQKSQCWEKLPFKDGQACAIIDTPKPGATFIYSILFNGKIRFGVRNKI